MIKRINKELVLYTIMCMFIGAAVMLLYILISIGMIGHKAAETLDSYNKVEHTGMLGVVLKNEEIAPWMTRNERLVVLALQAENNANETGKNVRIDVDSTGNRWIHEYSSWLDIYDVVF